MELTQKLNDLLSQNEDKARDIKNMTAEILIAIDGGLSNDSKDSNPEKDGFLSTASRTLCTQKDTIEFLTLIQEKIGLIESPSIGSKQPS